MRNCNSIRFCIYVYMTLSHFSKSLIYANYVVSILYTIEFKYVKLNYTLSLSYTRQFLISKPFNMNLMK
jgi:hypothetical protein